MPASDPWPPTLLGEEPSGDFTASGFANEAASPTGYTDQSDSCASADPPLFAPPLFAHRLTGGALSLAGSDDTGDEIGGGDGGEFAYADMAATRIQAAHRGNQARREMDEQQRAAISIQSVHRGKAARRSGATRRREPELQPEPEQQPEREMTAEEILESVERDNALLQGRLVEKDEELARLRSRLAVMEGEAAAVQELNAAAAAAARSEKSNASLRSQKGPSLQVKTKNEALFRREQQAQKEKLERLAARKQQFIDLEMEECTFAPPPRPDRGALPTEPKK